MSITANDQAATIAERLPLNAEQLVDRFKHLGSIDADLMRRQIDALLDLTL